MKKHGHPILGGVAGFFFGLFLGVTLVTAGVIELGSVIVTILPIAFLVLGIAWGMWAPLVRGKASTTA
jgi:hypothetical protein